MTANVRCGKTDRCSDQYLYMGVHSCLDDVYVNIRVQDGRFSHVCAALETPVELYTKALHYARAFIGRNCTRCYISKGTDLEAPPSISGPSNCLHRGLCDLGSTALLFGSPAGLGLPHMWRVSWPHFAIVVPSKSLNFNPPLP